MHPKQSLGKVCTLFGVLPDKHIIKLRFMKEKPVSPV